MSESQEPAGDRRNRVLLVVDVRHAASQLAVNEIGERLVPDARHAVADHTHGHGRGQPQAEGDAIEEGERRAERVADDCDGRRALCREGFLYGREDSVRGAA